MNRRIHLQSLTTVLALAAVATLSGCASVRTLSTEVSSYGEWPAGRQGGRYAFERLPSQASRAAEADALEASASEALKAAGFTPAAAGQEADVLVQVAARDARAERQIWDDPLWWHGGPGFGVRRAYYSPWYGPRWAYGGRWAFPRYERQVAVLIRDRASGKPLFEAHAESEGNTLSDGPLLAAMFKAALADFPKLGINPRRVDVAIAP